MPPAPTRFPARRLFSLSATNMASNVLRYTGPMGIRTAASPEGGQFSGDRLKGTLAPGLATEWQLESTSTPGLAFVEGLFTLLPDEGPAILMRYMGRRSARYGTDSWRVAVSFEAAADGPHDWLNDALGVARIDKSGDDLHFTVHELLGRKSNPDADALETDTGLLYRMIAQGSVGERHIVHTPISTRYMTIAEEGCETTGQLSATWPAGFAWGAHRTSRTPEGEFTLPLHIDMRVSLVTESGEALLQYYQGTTARSAIAPDPDTDRSWLTIAVFEAAVDGPNAYLNGIVALGIGWVEDNEAHYEYRIWA
jgi:hypothetical protein